MMHTHAIEKKSLALLPRILYVLSMAYLIGCTASSLQTERTLFSIPQVKPAPLAYPDIHECVAINYANAFKTSFNGSAMEKKFLLCYDNIPVPQDFISSRENFYRAKSLTLDSTDVNEWEGWRSFDAEKKRKLISEQKRYYRRLAETVRCHIQKFGYLVTLYNNTEIHHEVCKQDDAFMCILQAQLPTGHWIPIQYLMPSYCGNSYHTETIEPGICTSFVTTLPDSGNMANHLRFKMLGKNQFYYSNSFSRNIDPKLFVNLSDVSGSLNKLYDGHKLHFPHNE